MMLATHLKPLASSRMTAKSSDAAIDFLMELWADYRPSDYTFMGWRQGDRWAELHIRGDRRAKIAGILADHPPEQFDVYFCPNAFAAPQRKTEMGLPSRYAWCDIDDAAPDAYDPAPNILWRTSPGRFQGMWVWSNEAPAPIAEQYSRNIVLKDGGDKGGWSITKMLRLPGTINHKPHYNRPVVKLLSHDLHPQRLPASLAKVHLTSAPEKLNPLDISGLDAVAIKRRYRRAVGLKAGTLMFDKVVRHPDRSGAVYMATIKLMEAGASDPEIAAVLLTMPYFTEKWGSSLAKAEDQIARIRARMEASR